MNSLENYIDSVEWRFAETMPQWPHWYTMLDWNPDKANDFKKLAKMIFDEGYDEKWGDKTVRYLNIGKYKYWSMDPSAETTNLINRAEI